MALALPMVTSGRRGATAAALMDTLTDRCRLGCLAVKKMNVMDMGRGDERDSTMTSRRIGTHEEWLAASAELLEREKELTRMGDELARQRRELPWVPVEKDYPLQTGDGARTLAELFDGRSQLVVYHFMFGPGYQAGCPTC